MANSLLYGFYQLKDIANQRAITVNRDLLVSAVQMSAGDHNQQLARMMNLFADPLTIYTERFNGATNARLQPLDENGRALPIKGSQYNVAYPIQMGGSAWGTNRVTNAKRTVQNLNDDTSNMYQADVNWMADHILAALMYNGAGWTFQDPEWGDLTIFGLANGDTTLYANTSGVPATDNHYYAQAAAIADATNPFPALRTELIEHPENEDNIFHFIPSDQRTAVEGLATFTAVTDPNIVPADTTRTITGNPNTAYPGTLFGRVANGWAIEWPRLPSTYGISLAVGGTPPLGARQDPEEELTGFKPQGEIDVFPFFESQWFRRIGFGGRNRTGAVVWRIGSASYAIPTSYGSPMP